MKIIDVFTPHFCNHLKNRWFKIMKDFVVISNGILIFMDL